MFHFFFFGNADMRAFFSQLPLTLGLIFIPAISMRLWSEEKKLGKNFVIESSYGHLRDLPKSKMGVDIENDFTPQYVIPRKSYSRGSNKSNPGLRASGELYPAFRDYKKLLEAGVCTLGLYPAGNGIPGRAVAVRTQGSTPAEMILADDVYLKILEFQEHDHQGLRGG